MKWFFFSKGLYIKHGHFWEEKCWTLFQMLSVGFMQCRMLVFPFLKRDIRVLFILFNNNTCIIIIIIYCYLLHRPKNSIYFVASFKIIFLLVRGYVKCKCICWMFEFADIGFCITILYIENIYYKLLISERWCHFIFINNIFYHWNDT